MVSPKLLVTEAASAAGAASAVLGAASGERLIELAWAQDPSAGQEADSMGAPDGLPLALSIATAVTPPVWLSSRAELARRFPRLADVPAPGKLACAVLPLPADGVRLGFLALMFAGPHEFDPREREYLLSLADEAALGLSRWSRPAGPPRLALSGPRLDELVDALSRTETVDAVATVIAERGAVGGASFANVAVLDPGAGFSARMLLTLVFGRPHALDGVSDQIALAALGSAVADAISRAAAHDSDRDLVASLQRSLLAGPLPQIPGVRLGTRYQPAEARHGMGGDWYDAIPLSGGRVMLVVGDVAGHGLEAAMTMGQVRSAARALAPSHQPAGLLAALDQFLSTTASERLATAVVVVIDPARRTLRYCQAGHPPPLLRQPDGSVTPLDQATGLLLGLETSDRPESETSYAPGSYLLLYTDGLVERRDDPSIGSGIARLTDQLTRAVPPSPAQLCDVLISDGLPSEGREDDTAILCALLS